jgi:hypothetical protein
MARSAIGVGFPNPNYVTELGNRDAILPGAYEIEQGALTAVSSPSIGNLTLAATAAAIDKASLAQTIAALTLAAAGGTTVSASLGRTLPNLTLAAAANVVDGLVLAATVPNLALAATVDVIDGLVLAATIDPITLAATARAVDTIVLDAAIGAIALNATGAVVSSSDGVYPWWWTAYVRRHEAEREAARLQWREENAIEGDGWGELPMPVAHGDFIHDPDEQDIAALAAAALWLLAA